MTVLEAHLHLVLESRVPGRSLFSVIRTFTRPPTTSCEVLEAGPMGRRGSTMSSSRT